MKRVKCSIIYYYDPESYLYEWENTRPSDIEILSRCRTMMLEDIMNGEDPFESDYILAEFVEE